jgi:teichuronic acid exporter
MSKSEKIVSGLAWTFSSHVLQLVLGLIVSIILARLMVPSEFGLIGMISVFVAVGEVLMDGGMSASLVREANPNNRDYSTVFYMNLGMSCILYLILFLSAPWIAGFFHQPVLTPIVRVYMLSIVILSFSSIQVTKLNKDLNFKAITLSYLPSLGLSGIIGITMAYRGYGVWSIVAMHLSKAAFYSAFLWIRSGWKPSFILDKDILKRHFGFGYKLLLSAILDRIYQNVYNLVIGRFFSPVEVGYYTRSSTLVQVPVQAVGEPLHTVTFPVLSSMQHDDARLQMSYKKLMQQSLFLIVPVLSMMILVAIPLFRVMLTEKWLPAVPYFRILCLASMLATVNAFNLNVLLVKGRSDLYLKLSIVEKVFITAGVLSSFKLGIYALLYFQVASSVIMFLINSSVAGKMIAYSGWQQVLDVYHIFLIGLVSAGLTWTLNHYWVVQQPNRIEDLLRIVVLCLCYTGSFLGICFTCKVQEMYDFNDLIIKKIRDRYILNHA